MDPQRKNRSDKYHEKKEHHDKHDKFQKLGLNEEEGNLIEGIQSMSPTELHKFMENKFDKMVKSNEKLFPKICKAAQKRINNFMKEFKAEQKSRLVKFVKKHTGQTLTEQETKQIFEAKAFQPFKLNSNELINIAYIWSRSNNEPKIFMARVSIFEPKQQFSNVKEKYYVKGIQEKTLELVDFKRFKKQCTQFLEEHIRSMELIEAALDEQDL